MYKSNNGFTIIELLIGIAVISILSGITLTVLNPIKAQRQTKAGVHISILKDLGDGLGVFHVAENRLPSPGANGNPFESTDIQDVITVEKYLSKWPADPEVYYNRITSSDGDYICLSAPDVAETRAACPHLVYISPHNSIDTGGNYTCAGVVVRCTTACDAGGAALDLNNCETLTGNACNPSGVNACTP